MGPTSTRSDAVALADEQFRSGRFFDQLARRVAIPTAAEDATTPADLHAVMDRYLDQEIRPDLEAMGYTVIVYDNPDPRGGPFLVARRREGGDRPTVLTYGHADTVRGLADRWADGRSPWVLERSGDRWYGRGTADNKAQHSINLAALASVIKVRGELGFNSTVLLETSEEIGSPGLNEFAERHRDELRADVLIGSDGPRLHRDQPLIFGGTRGAINFDLRLTVRERGHHSGNWGGLLANPAVNLANAIASIADAHGRIRIPEWRPTSLTPEVRHAIAGIEIEQRDSNPDIDAWYGEPGLTPRERVFGWNSFEVLAFEAGEPSRPVNAIPPSAWAHCQLRFVVGTDTDDIIPALERHLGAEGFRGIEVTVTGVVMGATRLDPDDPWARLAAESIERTVARPAVLAPNLGGSLPNNVFADTLDMPTVWIPHSYPGCNQHAPDEHVLEPLMREGLQIMTGLFWDVGAGTGVRRRTPGQT